MNTRRKYFHQYQHTTMYTSANDQQENSSSQCKINQKLLFLSE